MTDIGMKCYYSNRKPHWLVDWDNRDSIAFYDTTWYDMIWMEFLESFQWSILQACLRRSTAHCTGLGCVFAVEIDSVMVMVSLLCLWDSHCIIFMMMMNDDDACHISVNYTETTYSTLPVPVPYMLSYPILSMYSYIVLPIDLITLRRTVLCMYRMVWYHMVLAWV